MPWEFVVSQSRRDPTGGIHLEGELRGTFEGNGEPAELVTASEVIPVPQAMHGRAKRTSFTSRGVVQGGEHDILVLYGLADGIIPIGSIVRGPVPQ